MSDKKSLANRPEQPLTESQLADITQRVVADAMKTMLPVLEKIAESQQPADEIVEAEAQQDILLQKAQALGEKRLKEQETRIAIRMNRLQQRIGAIQHE